MSNGGVDTEIRILLALLVSASSRNVARATDRGCGRAAILFILGGRSLFQSSFTFETYIDQSVAGLEMGALLKFRGVPLGQVNEIVTSASEYESAVPVDRRRGYVV